MGAGGGERKNQERGSFEQGGGRGRGEKKPGEGALNRVGAGGGKRKNQERGSFEQGGGRGRGEKKPGEREL